MQRPLSCSLESETREERTNSINSGKSWLAHARNQQRSPEHTENSNWWCDRVKGEKHQLKGTSEAHVTVHFTTHDKMLSTRKNVEQHGLGICSFHFRHQGAVAYDVTFSLERHLRMAQQSISMVKCGVNNAHIYNWNIGFLAAIELNGRVLSTCALKQPHKTQIICSLVRLVRLHSGQIFPPRYSQPVSFKQEIESAVEL